MWRNMKLLRRRARVSSAEVGCGGKVAVDEGGSGATDQGAGGLERRAIERVKVKAAAVLPQPVDRGCAEAAGVDHAGQVQVRGHGRNRSRRELRPCRAMEGAGGVVVMTSSASLRRRDAAWREVGSELSIRVCTASGPHGTVIGGQQHQDPLVLFRSRRPTVHVFYMSATTHGQPSHAADVHTDAALPRRAHGSQPSSPWYLDPRAVPCRLARSPRPWTTLALERGCNR